MAATAPTLQKTEQVRLLLKKGPYKSNFIQAFPLLLPSCMYVCECALVGGLAICFVVCTLGNRLAECTSVHCTHELLVGRYFLIELNEHF